MRFPFMTRASTEITANTMIAITEQGKKAAEDYESSNSAGGGNYAVLAALDERSPLSIRDLSKETSVDLSEVRMRVKIMAKQGLVKIMKEEG